MVTFVLFLACIVALFIWGDEWNRQAWEQWRMENKGKMMRTKGSPQLREIK